MADRAQGERGQRRLDRLDVGLERGALAGHADRLADPLGGGLRERERVGLAQRRLVAVALDPRDDAELVEQLAHLPGGGLDHPHVPGLRVLELAAAGERAGEAVHRRKRRPQVVARQRDEAGERGVVGHTCS